MATQMHPAATGVPPSFFPDPGAHDTLMWIIGIFLVLSVLGVGLLFFHLHTLPERIAHKRQKLQFELVAVLGLLALFTHIHLFWVAGLILALIEIPDVGGVFSKIANSLAAIAHNTSRHGQKAEDGAPPKSEAERSDAKRELTDA